LNDVCDVSDKPLGAGSPFSHEYPCAIRALLICCAKHEPDVTIFCDLFIENLGFQTSFIWVGSLLAMAVRQKASVGKDS
jgi:hypothetical protein